MTRRFNDDWTLLTLQAMPGTHRELQARLGANIVTVKRWCRILRAMGWAHVSEWRRSDGPGQIQPVIHAGPGIDVPCDLVAKPMAQVQRDWQVAARAAMRATDAYAGFLAGERIRDRARRAAKRVQRPAATPFDPLFAPIKA